MVLNGRITECNCLVNNSTGTRWGIGQHHMQTHKKGKSTCLMDYSGQLTYPHFLFATHSKYCRCYWKGFRNITSILTSFHWLAANFKMSFKILIMSSNPSMVWPLNISRNFSSLTAPPDPSDPPNVACQLYVEEKEGREAFPSAALPLWNSLSKAIRQAKADAPDDLILFSGF